MLGIGARLRHRNLVRAVASLDRQTVDDLGAGPALGRSQDDHRPHRALAEPARARVTLDCLDFGQRAIDVGNEGGIRTGPGTGRLSRRLRGGWRGRIGDDDQSRLLRGDARFGFHLRRRIGLQRLEITADGNRFRDHRAVVEHQRRHAHERIDRGVARRFLLQGAEVDLLDRQLDPLFRQKDAGAPRIGRATAVVKLHVVSRLGRSIGPAQPITAVGARSRQPFG